MKKLVFFVIIFVFSSAVYAETYGNITVDKIVSVYDGDTFRCNIKGWPKIAGENIAVRVKSIDTPEIRCKKSYSDSAPDYQRRTSETGIMPILHDYTIRYIYL